MTPNELAAKLKSMYDNADENEATAMIRLFGILYAEQLKVCRKEYSVSPTRIAQMAFPNNHPYATEVSKGIKLARYVQLREEWAGHF